MDHFSWPEWACTITETEPHWAFYDAQCLGTSGPFQAIFGRSTFPFWGS